MHPVEHLRSLALARGTDQGPLIWDAALALGRLADEAERVLACRRLVDNRPAAGALWTLCARVLDAIEPAVAGEACVGEVVADDTPEHLRKALPPEATVTVLGWPEIGARALDRRSDVTTRAVDALGEGFGLVSQIVQAGGQAEVVPEWGAGGAVARSDLVVLEALAIGPDGLVAVAGSLSAAVVAHHAGVPVWVVAGAGRALPGPLWSALVRRLAARAPCGEAELVPLDLAASVIGPRGAMLPAEVADRADCPVVAELARP